MGDAVGDHAFDRGTRALRYREEARRVNQRAARDHVPAPGGARVAGLVGDDDHICGRDVGDLVASRGVGRRDLSAAQAHRGARERQARGGVGHGTAHRAGRRLPVLGQCDRAEIDRLPRPQRRGERDHPVLIQRKLQRIGAGEQVPEFERTGRGGARYSIGRTGERDGHAVEAELRLAVDDSSSDDPESRIGRRGGGKHHGA